MSDGQERIALLIDAENVRASNIDKILTVVARHGSANDRRAYGNWKAGSLKDWEAKLHEHAIRPMQQFSYCSGKNASDMAIVVDAMDLLYEGRIDGFALVSSDADFTPLAMRLVSAGMNVYGFGRGNTPEAFIRACSKFTPLEKRAQPVNGEKAAIPIGDRNKLRGDTRLVSRLRHAIAAESNGDVWAPFDRVLRQIEIEAWFEPGNYRGRDLLGVVKATELFSVETQNRVVMVRDKRKT